MDIELMTSEARPVPRVRLLGQPMIDIRAVRSTKPLELVAALLLAGGRYSRDGLIAGIYGGEASESALPTLAYRARLLGIPVVYESFSGYYSVEEPVSFDVMDVLRLTAAGRVADALCLYRGPFLPRSGSPFAATLRRQVDDCLASAALATKDDVVIECAARTVLHPLLAESARRSQPDVASRVLGSSYLRGIGVVSSAQL